MRSITCALALSVLAGSASAQLINRVNGLPFHYSTADDVTALANGDLAIAGEAYTFDSGFESFATLTRVGPDGVPLWQLKIDEIAIQVLAFGVRELTGGDLILGFFRDFSSSSLSFAGVSGSGTVNWTTRIFGARAYDGAGIEIDPGTSFALVASQLDDQFPIAQLLRLNAQTGALDFNRMYAPTFTAQAFDCSFTDVAVLPGGDFFVTGVVTRTIDFESTDKDILVARISRANGSVIWAKAYGTPYNIDLGFPYEIGRGIDFNAAGQVVVAARTDDPTQTFGPESALHLLLDPANGNLIAHSVLLDTQVANASVERLSTGEILVSGSRSFGDGQGFARMWLLDPATMAITLRAEYRYVDDGISTSRGTAAVEHLVPAQGLVLTGTHFTTNNIGYLDQMFIRTDLTLNDGCSAEIIVPEPVSVQVTVTPIDLTPGSVTTDVFAYSPPKTLQTLQTALVCEPCIGDLNGDNVVDDVDFVIFASAYNILDCADPSMPPGCPADLNGDLFVDDSDFVRFANAYNQLLCP
jgi:hypothetical protein